MKKIVNGVYVDLTDEEILLANQRTRSNDELIMFARSERDTLLSESDVHALVDRITDEWRTYRQALRDVPSQAGFPNNITWPTKP